MSSLGTGHVGQVAISGESKPSHRKTRIDSFITLQCAYKKPWPIAWLLQPLARTTARFQTNNKSCAGKGTEGGRGGIGKRL